MTDNLQPVFEYLDEKFRSIDQRFDQLEEKVDGLQKSVDGQTKNYKEISDEHIILRDRVDTLEKKIA